MAGTIVNTHRKLKRKFILTAMKGRRDFLNNIIAVSGVTTKITRTPEITHQIVYDIDGGTYWIHTGTTVTASSTAYKELY